MNDECPPLIKDLTEEMTENEDLWFGVALWLRRCPLSVQLV